MPARYLLSVTPDDDSEELFQDCSYCGKELKFYGEQMGRLTTTMAFKWQMAFVCV